MTITLERLKHTEINLLRELRNAERNVFFDETYVTTWMQEIWWAQLQKHDEVRFFTIWLNGVMPVGFLSVKLSGGGQIVGSHYRYWIAEVGNLLLAPAHRGKGVMHMALTEVRRFYSPLTFWVAYVKPTNEASLKLFARHEFVQLDPTPKRSQKKSSILANVQAQ